MPLDRRSRNGPSAEPSLLTGLLGAVIPLAAAIVIVAIGGFLAYLFWFGADWLFDWLR